MISKARRLVRPGLLIPKKKRFLGISRAGARDAVKPLLYGRAQLSLFAKTTAKLLW